MLKNKNVPKHNLSLFCSPSSTPYSSSLASWATASSWKEFIGQICKIKKGLSLKTEKKKKTTIDSLLYLI